jgi:hypothetical protein
VWGRQFARPRDYKQKKGVPRPAKLWMMKKTGRPFPDVHKTRGVMLVLREGGPTVGQKWIVLRERIYFTFALCFTLLHLTVCAFFMGGRQAAPTHEGPQHHGKRREKKLFHLCRQNNLNKVQHSQNPFLLHPPGVRRRFARPSIYPSRPSVRPFANCFLLHAVQLKPRAYRYIHA